MCSIAASREEKEDFFNSLQQALAEVPLSKPFDVLGDFNARVRSRGGT